MSLQYINLLFLKYVQIFCHKCKWKCKQGDRSSSSQARSDTSTGLFMAIVLFNFYLNVLIYYHFPTLFDIFYSLFCLYVTSASLQ
jgi:hypothetical protein